MMMMIGTHPPRPNPTVQIPFLDDPTSHILHSPLDYSLYEKAFSFETNEYDEEDFDIPIDTFSCDNFRMFDFKVKKCTRARSHDWVECPYAHPGEKARRRDPRTFHYSGSACPDFRKGACRKGDACEFSHGVFECWLHPARYRTLPCKDGTHCRRRICFFAHTPEQLRILSPDSPPARDSLSRLNELRMSVGSPRSPVRNGFVGPFLTRYGLGEFDSFEEEPVMERVESGKDLRERIYAKIGKENSLERVGRRVGLEPDVGWVVDLVN